MDVSVDVAEEGADPEVLSFQVSDLDSVTALAERVAGQLELDSSELLEALQEEHGFSRDALVSQLPSGVLRLRRACVELHFEGEVATHRFPVRAKWARVHRWGCRHFHVAADACANLELRDGAPDGPRLNEALPIGTFAGCRPVWLIKPGAEPYGRR
jgi:hypothetical protein